MLWYRVKFVVLVQRLEEADSAARVQEDRAKQLAKAAQATDQRLHRLSNQLQKASQWNDNLQARVSPLLMPACTLDCNTVVPTLRAILCVYGTAGRCAMGGATWSVLQVKLLTELHWALPHPLSDAEKVLKQQELPRLGAEIRQLTVTIKVCGGWERFSHQAAHCGRHVGHSALPAGPQQQGRCFQAGRQWQVAHARACCPGGPSTESESSPGRAS